MWVCNSWTLFSYPQMSFSVILHPISKWQLTGGEVPIASECFEIPQKMCLLKFHTTWFEDFSHHRFPRQNWIGDICDYMVRVANTCATACCPHLEFSSYADNKIDRWAHKQTNEGEIITPFQPGSLQVVHETKHVQFWTDCIVVNSSSLVPASRGLLWLLNERCLLTLWPCILKTPYFIDRMRYIRFYSSKEWW